MEPASDAVPARVSESPTCHFCRLLDGSEPLTEVLYEDDSVLVILDQDRVVKGHTLVIWKAHRRDVSDLTEAEYAHFSAIFHRTERALRAATHADTMVVLKSGGLVPHVHFHSYPLTEAVRLELLVDLIAKRRRHDAGPGEHERLVARLQADLAP
jgi:diadenosine tetraphosphate (Ap4A) HIT family hydrolase